MADNSSSPKRLQARPRTLALAVDYVEKHFGVRYLFPIKPGAKFPPLIKDNLAQASNDPKQLAEWEAKWPGCNWGLSHRISNVLVADVDVNKAKGKTGQATYDDLDLIYGWPETETTTTPSGGFHKIYIGEHIMALGLNGFGKDIDSPNYTLIPGCTFDDGTSYVGNDMEAVAAEPWMYEVIKASKIRKSALSNAGEIVVELDQQANIDTAIDFLRSDAPPSIEGQQGDYALLKAAYYLKDLGISQQLGADLLNEHFNPRCEPPWDYDDLVSKMAGAYSYANLSKVGGKTGEADFSDDPPEPITPMGQWDPEKKVYKLNEKKIAKAKRAREKARKRDAAKPDSERTYMPTLDEVVDAYVYVMGSDIFVAKEMPPQLPTGYHPPRQILKAPAFDRGFAYLYPKKGRASDMLLRRKKGGIARASQLVYRPDIASKFFRVGNESFLNLYVPSGIAPTFDPDNVEAVNALRTWDAHLAYLFPDVEQRNLILNWLAWLIQNMEKKPKFALIVQGPRHGTGKSFVGQMLKSIVGSYNTSRVTAKMLGSTFNQYAQNAKLIIVEELRAVDKREVKDTLHDMISEDEVTINSKNEKLVTMINCFGIFAMTNVDAALIIDPDDRRYAIVKTDAVPRPDDYYVKLYDLLKSKVAIEAIAYSLMNRDLTGYNGQGRAPMTSAKAAMISAGGSALQHWVEDHAGEWPLCARLTTMEEIIDIIPRRFVNAGTDQHVADTLKAALAGEKVRVPVNGVKKTLWAINADIEVTTLLRSRMRAINSADKLKVTNRNAALAAIYLDDIAGQKSKQPPDGDDFAE